MKTITYLIILLALLIQMQACKKDTPIGSDETTNWGYVKEFYTQKPIPNAMIVVYGKNPLWAVQDTLYTDSNGRYEFGYVKYLAELDATAPGYIPNRRFTQDELVGRFNRTIYLYQPAEMMLHVKNVKPFDQSDYINLTDFFSPFIYLYGTSIDTTICCLTAKRYTEVVIGAWVRKDFKEYSNNVKYTPTKATGNVVEINY